MPEWRSSNGRARLLIQAESMSGRFAKASGECSYQGSNGLIAYEDGEFGTRRLMAAEQLIVSEDSNYVYFTTRGRVVEQTERFAGSGRRSARRRGREESTHVGNR